MHDGADLEGLLIWANRVLSTGLGDEAKAILWDKE